jgi:hypothetical protein
MEKRVFDIWCQVLPHLKSIQKTSSSSSFFSLGGNSLSLMRLHQLYRKEFPQSHVKITDMFQHITINDHACFFLKNEKSEHELLDKDWAHLGVIEGKTTLFNSDFLK